MAGAAKATLTFDMSGSHRVAGGCRFMEALRVVRRTMAVGAECKCVFNCIFAIDSKSNAMVNLKIRRAIRTPNKRCRLLASFAEAPGAGQDFCNYVEISVEDRGSHLNSSRQSRCRC